MKVQIIYLDIHDDNISARDKLNWAQTPRVAMVWPKQGKVLSSRLDLALLHHHAKQLGRQIALVTQDPDVQRGARDLGVPCAASLSDLPEDHWPSPGPPVTPLPRGKAELWTQPRHLAPGPSLPASVVPAIDGLHWFAFGSAILAVLMLTATLLPSASIVVAPETAPALMEMELQLQPEACPPGIVTCVPATQVGVRMQGELRLPTSGRVPLPKSRAQGEVVFVNQTDEPLDIPAGTGVRSSSDPALRFETTEALHLEGEVGASAGIGVIAVDPGSRSNLPVAAIDAVEGPLGLRVSVSNPVPTTGGDESFYAGVTSQDILRLREGLREQLVQQARVTIEASLAPADRLADDSLRIGEIFEEVLDQAAGEASETVSGTLDARITALTYNQADLTAAAYQFARAQLGDSRQIASGSMELAQIGDLQLQANGSAWLSARARFSTFQSMDPEALGRSIRGKPSQHTGEILARDHDLTLRRLELFPRWFPWIPWLPSRIDFTFEWTGQ
jgi:hypothetical protein